MYNFKKNARVYLVEGSNKHNIKVYSDLSASQTFDEQSYRRKTLHSLNDLHEGAVIVKAAPANFSFTTPIIISSFYPVIIQLGTSYNNGTIPSFDLYIESDNIIYKLQTCVIDNITINAGVSDILTASISGSSSSIGKFTGEIPGTLVVSGSEIYCPVQRNTVSINNTTLPSIAAINIEFSNEVSWLDSDTIHTTLGGSIAYPTRYVVTSRRVSGSVTQFLTSDNIDTVSDTSTTAPITISVGSGDFVNAFSVSMPSTVFTRRLSLDDLFTRVYDFRLNTNTTNVVPSILTLTPSSEITLRTGENILDRTSNIIYTR